MNIANENERHPFDDDSYMEHQETVLRLFQAVFQDKLAWLDPSWRVATAQRIRSTLSFEGATDEQKGRLIASLIASGAHPAGIDLQSRAEAICEVIPFMRPWVKDSIPFKSKNGLSPVRDEDDNILF